jgi:TonB family protein
MPFSRNKERYARIPQRLVFAILALAFCSTVVSPLLSLAQKAEKSSRKILVSSRPEYPEVLRRAQVGGVCRLKATVLPNGTVGNVEILGGNPILAESGVAAVKKWKYAPGPSETVEDVTLTFNPN